MTAIDSSERGNFDSGVGGGSARAALAFLWVGSRAPAGDDLRAGGGGGGGGVADSNTSCMLSGHGFLT